MSTPALISWPEPVASTKDTGSRMAFWRVAAVAALFLLWEGVPMAMLGMPRYLGQYVVSALILVHFVWWLVGVAKKASASRFLLGVSAVFLWFFLVSFLSSSFIFQYDPREWIFAQFFIVPVLAPIMLNLWRVTVDELVLGIVSAGVGAALLVVAAPFGLDRLLVDFQRGSIYEVGHKRTVILKNEIAFSAIYLFFSVLLSRRHLMHTPLRFIAATFLLYVMVFSLDSRLALVAVIVALALGFVLFRGPALRKLLTFLLVMCAVPVLVPQLYDKYIGSIGIDNYLEAGNVQVRLDELAYFWRYFLETNGLGFGVFSLSRGSGNLAAWAAYNLYPGYTGIGVFDIGIFGSVVQFGWIGLAVTLSATFWCVMTFYRLGRRIESRYRTVGIAGFSFMLAFMLSPWPMDFFSLNWTILLGWSLLYLAWNCDRELRLLTMSEKVHA